MRQKINLGKLNREKICIRWEKVSFIIFALKKKLRKFFKIFFIRKIFWFFLLNNFLNILDLPFFLELRNNQYFPDTNRNWTIVDGIYLSIRKTFPLKKANFSIFFEFFFLLKKYSKKFVFIFERNFFDFQPLVTFFIQFRWIPHSKWSKEQRFLQIRTIKSPFSWKKFFITP